MNYVYEVMDEILHGEKQEGFSNKDTPSEENKKEEKKNDWGGFLKSMINNFIVITIYIILSSNLLYITGYMVNEKSFPTNINKMPYNTTGLSNIGLMFPYITMSGEGLTPQVLNWFSETIKRSWIYYRTLLRVIFTMFSTFVRGVDIIDNTQSGDVQKMIRRTFLYIYSIVSPLIAFFLLLSVSFGSYVWTMLSGVNSLNVDSPAVKLMLFFPVLGTSFFLSMILSSLQVFYTFILLLITPIIKSPSYIWKYMKSFSRLIAVLFFILLLSSVGRHLEFIFFIATIICIFIILFIDYFF